MRLPDRLSSIFLKSSKKSILILLSVTSMLYTTQSSAQEYATGIGIRLGAWNRGITAKHNFGGPHAGEAIIAFGGKSFMITGLYEHHTSFPGAEGLSWFFGGGAHVGIYQDGYDYFYYKYKGNRYVAVVDGGDRKTGFGADFILGLEYKFQKAPIALSLDTKPFVDFIGDFYGYWDVGLTFRFTL